MRVEKVIKVTFYNNGFIGGADETGDFRGYFEPEN